MKLTILQENLVRSISLASRFTTTKAQLPILGNILLSAKKTKLLVASTNLEVSVSSFGGANVEKDGEIAIPAKVLSELVINLPRDTITLESEKEQLKISAASFSSTILGMNSSDFPKIPFAINNQKALSLAKKELTDAFNKILFAVSVDETRPILTGVLFVFENGSLTLVATDGFRLSLNKIKTPNSKVKNQLVIPKTILSEIGRVSEGDDLLLELQEKEKQIIFGLGDIIFSSRLLEGDFPDYEKIIPKSSSHKVRVDKEDFLRAVKLASIFARDNANIVTLNVKGESLKIRSESSNAGNQEAKVEANIEGGEIEIAFNYKFLEDFINSVSGEEIAMEFSDPDKPGVFLDPGIPDYLHLIMPVKIQK